MCTRVCVCMCVVGGLIPDSLIRRSDAILVLTSGLKREVAAGKGLGPVACAPAVSAACSARPSAALSERVPSLVRGAASADARRLAASEGGCNTLDPRFIFSRVCLWKKKRNQNSEERRAGEKDEEEEEEDEGGVAKIGWLCLNIWK